jgi:glycosyltransferase involved in cell wall biosynthesis
MTKVLIFTSDLYQGGVAESTRKIIKLLDSVYDVSVCSYDSLPIEKKLPQSVDIYKLNLPLSVGFRTTELARFYVKLLRYAVLPLAIIKLLYVIVKVKPDVVYSLTYIPNIINILCSKVLKYRCIISERQDPREDLDEKSLLAKTVKYLYPQATTIHVNSMEMITAVCDFYRVEKNKIFNFDNFFFQEELISLAAKTLTTVEFKAKYKIVTSGRMSKQKGQWHLIPIISKLIVDGYDVELIILGEGELRGELQRLVADYGLNDNVHFVGNVDNPHQYVAMCDLFIFPSIWESFGNTLVEAMALGIPIASTVCRSGPRQIIDNGRYGLNLGVFPPYGKTLTDERVDRITASIKVLFDIDKVQYIQKSLSGYKRFDANVIKDRVFNLFGKS